MEALKAPFPLAEIRWRVGFRNSNNTRGSALAYVDARTVMERLDEVLGTDGWASEITPISSGDGFVGAKCRLTLFLEAGEVWREDFGAVPESGQEPLKSAASDAFKRAAVQFGIGRYLYELPTTWVDLDADGRMRETPELPDWALPESERTSEPEPERAPARTRRSATPRARWRD
ncbi:Rad52/Rad22 family DNA repair protein [Acidithiobacillus sp. M4-SHS-6]|uniref:Rad52/Rad22 family DNA repair protein n=1 Tax=Acidithiobacillus sp. M4-SHS-6 TaxID=3383024 RepID=UPI0039BDCC5B